MKIISLVIPFWLAIQGMPVQASAAPVTWTMINVNPTEQQGDAHLLEFADGQKFLIDVSFDGKALIEYLKKRKITAIDAVLISHPHKDHYGGLLPMVEAGIRVKQVVMNLPDRVACDHEKPWGCDYPHVMSLVEELKKHKIIFRSAKAGEIYYSKDDVRLQVLYAYGIRVPAIADMTINDTSVLLLLKVGKTRALFTGDLNSALGTYLAKHGHRLRADILKVPHHGTEGVAPNEFFDRVHPSFALVPSPAGLWKSDRSKRIREYFESHKIPTYVNGLDGDVTVVFEKTGPVITTSQKK